MRKSEEKTESILDNTMKLNKILSWRIGAADAPERGRRG